MNIIYINPNIHDNFDQDHENILLFKFKNDLFFIIAYPFLKQKWVKICKWSFEKFESILVKKIIEKVFCYAPEKST